MAQTLDIAYWLATEVENLSDADYGRAKIVEGRQEIIFDSLMTSAKIAWALKHKEFKLLKDWMVQPEIIFQGLEDNKVPVSHIEATYNSVSKADDSDLIMKRVMKEYGHTLHSPKGQPPYYEIEDIVNSRMLEAIDATELRT